MFQRFICVVGIGLAAVAAMSGAEKDGMAEYLNGTLPQRWSYSPEIPMDAPEATDAWWQSFGDSILDSLVAAGISNNYDVAMAIRRAEIARNSIRQTASGWMPVISASAGWSASQESGRIARPYHNP